MMSREEWTHSINRLFVMSQNSRLRQINDAMCRKMRITTYICRNIRINVVMCHNE